MADSDKKESNWSIVGFALFTGFGFGLIRLLFGKFIPEHFAAPIAILVVFLVAFPIFLAGKPTWWSNYTKPLNFGVYFLFIFLLAFAAMLFLILLFMP